MSQHLSPPPAVSWMMLPFVFFTASSVFFSVLISSLLRLVSWLCNLSLRVVARLVLVFGMIVGLSFLLSYMTRDEALWPTNLTYLIGAFVSALPTAILVGSRVTFGKIFSFGTVRTASQRITSGSKLALLAMLPLRILCIVGLVIWCVVLRNYWHYFYELNEHFMLGSVVAERYIAITVFLAIYLLSALYLSYRSPSPAILISLSFLLNLPLTVIAIAANEYQESGVDGPVVFEGLTKPFSTMCFGLAVSLAVCVAARSVVSIVGNNKIDVELPKKNNHQAVCLGTAFQSWQTSHERMTH